MTAIQRGGPRRWRIGPDPTGCGTASRRGPGADHRLALERAGAVAPRTGGALHRQKRYFVSEATVYRLLKAHDLITSPAFIVIKAADEFNTRRRAQPAVADRLHLLQGHRLGLVLSVDRARRLLALHHRLEAVHDHEAEDVTDTLELALTASGCDSARVLHKPRLLSATTARPTSPANWPNGSRPGMSHVRGAPLHPQTQGKIERWHQTLKNRILLENYFLPGDLEARSKPSSSITTTALPREPRTT
jgi:putative transposase